MPSMVVTWDLTLVLDCHIVFLRRVSHVMSSLQLPTCCCMSLYDTDYCKAIAYVMSKM